MISSAREMSARGGCERSDNRFEPEFVNGGNCIGKTKPLPKPLMLLGPRRRLVSHCQREDFNHRGARRTVAATLIISEASERCWAQQPLDSRFLERLEGRGVVRIDSLDPVAFRDDPPPRLA